MVNNAFAMFGLDPIKLLVSWLVILRSSKISLLKTSITSESSRLLDSAEKSFIDKSLERFVDLYAAAGHPNCVFKIDYSNLQKITQGSIKEISE